MSSVKLSAVELCDLQGWNSATFRGEAVIRGCVTFRGGAVHRNYQVLNIPFISCSEVTCSSEHPPEAFISKWSASLIQAGHSVGLRSWCQIAKKASG